MNQQNDVVIIDDANEKAETFMMELLCKQIITLYDNDDGGGKLEMFRVSKFGLWYQCLTRLRLRRIVTDLSQNDNMDPRVQRLGPDQPLLVGIKLETLSLINCSVIPDISRHSRRSCCRFYVPVRNIRQSATLMYLGYYFF